MKGRSARKYPKPDRSNDVSLSRLDKRYQQFYLTNEDVYHGVNNLRTGVIYSILGLGAAAGVFFVVRHFYKKTRKNIVESQSLEEGNPATYAKQLKMAFDNDNWAGWGTDEDVVFQIFDAIPTKAMYQKIQKAYLDLYGEPLNSRLEDELSSEEYNEILRKLNSKY